MESPGEVTATAGGLALDHWQDVAALVGIVATLFTVLGIAGTQFYTRRKDKREDKLDERDQQEAEAQANARLIDLITQEADKRVEIVRAEFKVQLLERDMKHAEELTSMRRDFETQIATIRDNAELYRCDLAPTCKKRPGAVAEIKVGGTD